MPPKRPRNSNQLAKSIIDIATGKKPDRDPTPEEEGKDAARGGVGPEGRPATYQEGAAQAACKRVQMDEIWSFVHAKNKNLKAAIAAPETAGDVWTWTAICADTKLIVSWLLGTRDMDAAQRSPTIWKAGWLIVSN